MPSQFVFLGESAGARIIKLAGDALNQIKTAGSEAVLMDLESHDLVPAGEAGDVVFRMILVTVKYSNGFQIRVTPKVDEVALAQQEFSQSGSGTYVCEAWVATRGARLSVRIQQLSRAGDFELVNAKAGFVIIREVP